MIQKKTVRASESKVSAGQKQARPMTTREKLRTILEVAKEDQPDLIPEQPAVILTAALTEQVASGESPAHASQEFLEQRRTP